MHYCASCFSGIQNMKNPYFYSDLQHHSASIYILFRSAASHCFNLYFYSDLQHPSASIVIQQSGTKNYDFLIYQSKFQMQVARCVLNSYIFAKQYSILNLFQANFFFKNSFINADREISSNSIKINSIFRILLQYT